MIESLVYIGVKVFLVLLAINVTASAIFLLGIVLRCVYLFGLGIYLAHKEHKALSSQYIYIEPTRRKKVTI